MVETFAKIWQFAKQEKRNLNKSVIINFIQSIIKIGDMAAIYVIIMALINGSGSKTPAFIAAGCILLQIVLFSLLQNFSQLQQTHAGYFMVADKRILIGNKIKKIPMGFFNESSTGELTGITTSVLDSVEFMAPEVLVLTLSGLVMSLVFIVAILIFDWRIGLVALAASICYLLISGIMEKKSAKDAPKRQKSTAQLVNTILETVQGMGVVKSFNLAGHGDKNIQNAIEYSKSSNLALEKTFTPFVILENIILHIASVLMIFLSAFFRIHGTLSLADTIMICIMAFVAFRNIQSAGSGIAEMRILGNAIDMANKTDSLSEMDEDGIDFSPEAHAIQFEHVSFSYGDRQILHDITFNLPDKSTTAIVGPSGSGKTTLCNLIARFWDIDKGSITIGGKNVKDYRLESLMKQISIVFQTVYLFADTIENNIKFGSPAATHEMVVEAAKKACCHDFISSLPDGYNTMIGEGGATLSGGERQRISIARAMLKDAPIIILDEATANVDPENEDKLQKAIESLTHGKTIVMIAHRLKTVRNADKILVLDNGTIVQEGKHDELVKQEGIYQDFVSQRKMAEAWSL